MKKIFSTLFILAAMLCGSAGAKPTIPQEGKNKEWIRVYSDHKSAGELKPSSFRITRHEEELVYTMLGRFMVIVDPSATHPTMIRQLYVVRAADCEKGYGVGRIYDLQGKLTNTFEYIYRDGSVMSIIAEGMCGAAAQISQ